MTRCPIRVLFDTEIFGNETFGGISRYFVELIRRLPQYGVFPRLFAPLTFNQHAAALFAPGVFGLRGHRALSNRLTRKAAYHLLALADRFSSKLLQFDLLHNTYYGRRLDVSAPQVSTVVDMIPELHPELFPKGNPHKSKRAVVDSASLVIAISECTKRDLIALYPELSVGVEVIHLAVDTELFQSRAVGEESDVVLFVGARRGYKNFSTFAKAAARLLHEKPEFRLLCVGGGPLRREEMEPFHRNGVESRVHQQTASDDELPRLYRTSSAFVFPSEYEGFGLPILEAFASGCPVLLSNASCFPEVAADAGEYFDPRDVESMLESMRRVTSDSNYRNTLRRRGLVRVADFTWAKTAEKTASAYRRTLGISP